MRVLDSSVAQWLKSCIRVSVTKSNHLFLTGFFLRFVLRQSCDAHYVSVSNITLPGRWTHPMINKKTKEQPVEGAMLTMILLSLSRGSIKQPTKHNAWTLLTYQVALIVFTI